MTVPKDGTYDLAILYGNQSGGPATQKLSVDGGDPVTVTYPSTENWTYRAKKNVGVQLKAGTHQLTLSKGDAEVTLDRIDLTTRTGAAAASYEATLADISGKPSYDYSSSAGVGTGALVLRSGDKAVFDVYAPRDGYYTVAPRASAAVKLALHGETVTATPGRPLRLYLVAGNNRIAMTSSHAAVRCLDVSGDGSATGALSYEGASATLAGGAKLVDSPHASMRLVHRLARQQLLRHRRVHGERALGRSLCAGRPLRAQRPPGQRPRLQHGHHVPYGGHHGRNRGAGEGHLQEHLELRRLLDGRSPRRTEEGCQQGDVRQRERLGAEHRPDRAGTGRGLTRPVTGDGREAVPRSATEAGRGTAVSGRLSHPPRHTPMLLHACRKSAHACEGVDAPMVFKRLLGALGVGGPTVDTVLDPAPVRPGGTLTGQVQLVGGKSDFEIEHITLELVARVEAEHEDGESEGVVAFDRFTVGGGFRLAEDEQRSVPFSVTLPWET